MYYIIVKYAEGLEVNNNNSFKTRHEALDWLEEHAVVDGPSYQVVYLNDFTRKTSNPQWVKG